MLRTLSASTRSGRTWCIGLFIATILALVSPGDRAAGLAAAPGGSGSLDATFGTNGIVDLGFGPAYVVAQAVAIQPDGKIVAAGLVQPQGALPEPRTYLLVRLHPDGSLDATFGSGGMVRTPQGGATAVLLQPDGKIVAAGEAFDLARYNPDGSPDTGFGPNGDGTANAGLTRGTSGGAVLQPDGKILVAGSVQEPGLAARDVALARFNADGTLDGAFGASGTVTAGAAGLDEYHSAVLLQPDGAIVTAGSGPGGFSLARLNADGSLDPGFGAGGFVAQPFAGAASEASAIVLQPDGRIVAAGLTLGGGFGDFALARFNPDGSVDPTFGRGGTTTTDFAGGNDWARSLVLQPDGRLVAGGVAASNPSSKPSIGDFALARYETDGTLDRSFGTSGRVTLRVGPPFKKNKPGPITESNGAFRALVVAGDRIVAVGPLRVGSEVDIIDRFVVARYLM